MKYLHSQKNLNNHSSLLYQELKKNYVWSSGGKHLAIVEPYSIATDGHDLCMFVSFKGEVEHGFYSSIARSKYKSFEEIMERGIKNNFLNLFKDINLQQSDISIYPTERALYLDNMSRIIPIYFIILPNNKPITMTQTESNFIISQYHLRNCFILDNMTFIDGTIASLLRSGNMQWPMFSYPSELSEP